MQLLKLRTGLAILFQPVRNNSRAFDKNSIFEDQAVIPASLLLKIVSPEIPLF